MSWYLGQSWLIILLSVLLGLLIGWMIWRLPWQRRYVTESEILTRVTGEHTRALAVKDAEIARLHGLLDRGGAAGTSGAASSAAVRAADADVTPVAVRETAVSVDVADAQVDSVDVEAVNLDGDSAGVDVEQVQTPSVDVSADEHAMAAVRPRAEDEGEAAPEDAGEEAGEAEKPADAAEEPADAAEEPADAAAATDQGADGGAAGAGSTQAAPLVGSAADDLERIEGIGPRIAAALRGAGIHSFEELATSDVARLQSALEAAGLRFAPSLPTWSRQARLLADGDEDGFLRLTEQLVGGRDIGRRA